VEDFTARNTLLGMFLANITTGEFHRTNLTANDYTLYIERGANGLTFKDAYLKAKRWNVHAYNYETQSQPSGQVLFDRFEMDSIDGSFLISSGFDGFAVKNGTIRQTGTLGHPIVRLYGSPRNVLIENVEAWGNAPFLDVTKLGAPESVTLRNVTYHGPSILGPGTSAIQGLVLDNVVTAP
jgi:hypothetical protein